MANNYFKFKQFTVLQDQCAMKVCTDACLFGALIADEIIQNKKYTDTCLDIGTGTGLLSLMVAQKNNIHIDAVEIDENAFLQAGDNIQKSLFENRISLYHSDILTFDPSKRYDVIISNPPFFENDLLSKYPSKNTAKHSTTLSLAQLVAIVNKRLKSDGFFSLLLPYHRIISVEQHALQFGLYLYKKVLVKQTPNHGYFRGILFFSKQEKDILQQELSIKNEQNGYSKYFTQMLKDYYLNF